MGHTNTRNTERKKNLIEKSNQCVQSMNSVKRKQIVIRNSLLGLLKIEWFEKTRKKKPRQDVVWLVVTYSIIITKHKCCSPELTTNYEFCFTFNGFLKQPNLCLFLEAFTYDVRCFLSIFDLPMYPNQKLDYISLFSKIRFSLTYLPT